jgi:hypothetical protein
MKFARMANSESWGRKDLCPPTTVDVENAFNSALWQGIVATLSRRNMPPRVIAIVRDYFRDRFVEDGDLRVRVSCGVPQVSGLDNK